MAVVPPSADSSADLSGCLDRLAWCEQAVRDLNDGARAHALLLDDDDRPKPYEDSSSKALLTNASLRASNIVHQLRSTLDNLVWQMVSANSQQPNGENAFPIRRSDNAKSQAQLERRLAGTSETTREAIESCQPWHWDDPPAHPLERLDRWWSSDKHNVLHLVVPLAGQIPIPGSEVAAPGTGLVLPDGSHVVPVLRQALGTVDEIVRKFSSYLADGRPPDLSVTPESVLRWAEAFRLRDPSATYLDDVHVLGVRSQQGLVDPAVMSDRDVRLTLAAVQRLLASPARKHHAEWLIPWERVLTRHLAGD